MEDKVKVNFTQEIKLRINGEVLEFQKGDSSELPKDTAEALYGRGVLTFGNKKAVKKPEIKMTPVEEVK